jgi:hypothetical protein
MRVRKRFEVAGNRDRAVEILDQDDTLTGLFPDNETRIVEKDGDRKTIVSHYRVLGQEGDATFHFDFLMDGSIRFHKVCDGRVWRELRGELSLEECGEERVRICIEMEGSTKSFVPEFTIKGPMQDQVEQMSLALKQRIESLG